MTIRRKYPTQAKSDAGFTLAELLVAMVIMSAVIAVGISLISSTFRVTASTQTRAELWGSMTNASVQLIRDVNDGSKITVSEPRHLAIEVVRDGKCQVRDWLVTGDKLVSTTIFYDATSCTGGSTERKVTSIKSGLKSFTFTYFSSASIDSPLPAPVSPGVVNRIGWAMQATPAGATAVLKLDSGAAFTGRGASSGGTGAEQTPLAAFLTVVTDRTGIEGVSAPVLSWTDATPELTQGWAVYRTSYPDGADAASSTGWEQLTYLPTTTPAARTMTFTDRSLPRGYTALYTVRATVPSGYGPSSNQVATGLRPVPSVLTSDGAQTSITLSWTAPIGATGYDIYRTEGGATSTAPVLYKRWDDIKSSATKAGSGAALRWSWTDTLTTGQSRGYVVVPVNRWERKATTGSTTGSLPTGEAVVKAYAGGTATTQTVVRPASGTSQHFTAPSAPVITLRANADWTNRVTRTPAAWTGGGSGAVTSPTVASKAGATRERSWEIQHRRLTTSAWSNLWSGTSAIPAGTASSLARYTQSSVGGQYRYYQGRSTNVSGASPWSASPSVLQRPAAPSCTAATSGLTTRQITVTGRPAASDAPRLSSLTYNNGREGVAWYSFEGAATTVSFDRMSHNTLHGFLQKTKNASAANGGWSDPSVKCDARTSELRVWTAGLASTTRQISVLVYNTGGNSASIAVDGFQTQPTSGGGQRHAFGESNPGLTHNTAFTLTARLTDGYNSVSYQDTIATRELPAPRLGGDAPPPHTNPPGRAWASTRRRRSRSARGATAGLHPDAPSSALTGASSRPGPPGAG